MNKILLNFNRLKNFKLKPARFLANTRNYSSEKLTNALHLIDSNDSEVLKLMESSMIIKEDFLSVDEEKSLLEEVEPYMKKLRYEFDHWDDAIHGYRETERLEWNEANKKILNRVKDCAFDHFADTKNTNLLAHVHILDLHENGYIKPHVDAVRFCGNTIAGLSLLSDAVMKLTHEKEKQKCASVLLKRRSLYIMRYMYISLLFLNTE